MHMNIYITPTNEERLRNEESMSGLINKLLYEYYDGVPDMKKRIDTPEQASKAIKQLSKDWTDVCPNGHILQAGRDRCATKGCRYSV